MDRLQRGYYRLAAANAFLKLKRTEFQAWFSRIMEKVHPGDYENIRLTQGDGGIDGILLSSGTAFAVYAPREMTESQVIAKMNSDFTSASNTMKERGAVLNGLVFVHNDEGLTQKTGPELLRLKQANKTITFARWTFEAIWRELETLAPEQLADLFGPGPTEENVDRLGFPAIREVIDFLERAEPPPLPEIGVPDADKLEHNRLSDDLADLLRVGRRRQGLVEQYLNGMTNPTAGESIAEAFRRHYASMKDSGASSTETFNSLWRFAGGEHFVQPQQFAAVTAVLAYFFASCDIFENAPPKA